MLPFHCFGHMFRLLSLLHQNHFHLVDFSVTPLIRCSDFSGPFRAVASTTLTPSQKATSCLTRTAAICPPGSYSPFFSGIEFCVACPYDTYSDRNGSSSCLPCPAGTRTFFAGSRSVQECYGLCPPGYYNSYRGLNYTGTKIGVPCAPCPFHMYSDQPGLTECIQCPLGTGTIAIATESSSKCTASNLEAFDPLVDCFTSESGFTQAGENCNLYCKPGFFSSDGLVASGCQPCPDGQQAFRYGSKLCYKSCLPGTFSVNGQNYPFPCALCPRGTFMPFDSATSCISCPLLTGTQKVVASPRFIFSFHVTFMFRPVQRHQCNVPPFAFPARTQSAATNLVLHHAVCVAQVLLLFQWVRDHCKIACH